MSHSTPQHPAAPATTDESITALRVLLDGVPGMPDAAWQTFNVGAMRKLLERLQSFSKMLVAPSAPPAVNGFHVEPAEAMTLASVRAERDMARAIIDDIRIAMEPGVTSVSERSGRIRAILAGYTASQPQST